MRPAEPRPEKDLLRRLRALREIPLRGNAQGLQADLAARGYEGQARRLAAILRSPGPADAAGRPRLVLCSLGGQGPGQISVEAVQALSRCEAVYHDLRDSRSRRFLERIHPIVLFVGDSQERRSKLAAALEAEVAAGKSVAWVTQGQPLAKDGPGARLVRHFTRRGLPLESLPAVSPIGAALSLMQRSLCVDLLGIQSCRDDAAQMNGWTADPGIPLVIWFSRPSSSARQARGLAAALGRLYGPDHPAWLFDQRAQGPMKRLKISGLPAHRLRLGSRSLLLLPPDKAKDRRPEPGTMVYPDVEDAVAGASAPERRGRLGRLERMARRLEHIDVDDDCASLFQSFGHSDCRVSASETILRELEASPLDGAGGLAMGLKGKSLVGLGLLKPGLESLDLAVRRSPGSAQCRLWRAEALIRDLKAAQSLPDLEFAAGTRGGELCWRNILGAVNSISGEPLERMRRELSARAEASSSDAGQALIGLMEVQARRVGEGLRRLTTAVDHGGEVWALGLRGAVQRRLRSYRGALRDFDSILARQPRAWAFIERALTLKMMGYHAQALVAARQALACRADRPMLFSLEGRIQADQRCYRDGAASLARALRLEPRNALLLMQRAAIEARMGADRAAFRDMQEAVDLEKGRRSYLPFVRERLSLFSQMTDREALVRIDTQIKGSSEGGDERRWAQFYSGMQHFKAGRYRLAEGRLRAVAGEPAARDGNSGGLRGEASGYAALARSLEALGGRSLPPGPKLYICGLGPTPPRQATLESLSVLARCEVIFSNFPADLGIGRFLSLLSRDIRVMKFDLNQSIGEIVAELDKGRRVGFATRGHALVYGNPAYHIVRALKERGHQAQTINSVSLVDILPAADRGEDSAGLQVYDASLVLADGALINNRLPLLILFPHDIPREAFRSLGKKLLRSYPDRQECVYYQTVDEPQRIPLARLEKIHRPGDKLGLLVTPVGHD